MTSVAVLLIVAFACIGASAALKNEKPLAALGSIALGAVVGAVFSSAADPGLRSWFHHAPSEPHPILVGAPAGTPYLRDQAANASTPPGRATPLLATEFSEGGSPSRQQEPEPRAHERAAGADEFTFSGGEASFDGSRPVLRGAIAAKLHVAGYPSSGGGRIIELDGDLQDLEPTLGQIPTVSLSVRWRVVQVGTRRVLAVGSLQDLRGTGTSAEAARHSAIDRGASRVAESILSEDSGS